MKEYGNDELIVYWSPELCVHAKACVRILPGVFRPDERPWVNLEGASAREVILAVDRCPSGALRYSLSAGSSLPEEAADGPGRARPLAVEEGRPAGVSPDTDVVITVTSNGPLLTQGNVRLVGIDGKAIDRAGRLALCRCGESSSRPFCDGAHARKGWRVDPETGKD